MAKTGWVVVKPDGEIAWRTADKTRRAAISIAWVMYDRRGYSSEIGWKSMRRQGYRVVECAVVEEGR